jgi:hypothetical protein
MASTKHEQQIKCNVRFDAFVGQVPNQKMFQKCFYSTSIMANILTIIGIP